MNSKAVRSHCEPQGRSLNRKEMFFMFQQVARTRGRSIMARRGKRGFLLRNKHNPPNNFSLSRRRGVSARRTKYVASSTYQLSICATQGSSMQKDECRVPGTE
ncbi:hypothetical protein ARMGADRAFT_1008299 [Armillaria gallica]|uniref:Uncharacterized protein n=1 Tax=Armillaria gallica TaxID=47427 RepID=A0A2H3DX63_ARMGA|nr:hypothetical protein ARMGADRAFT_1008299 [Armillaria gallica]